MTNPVGKERFVSDKAGFVDKEDTHMQLLEERIRQDGQILPGGVLKVGSFLNQQIDISLLRAMAQEVVHLYAGCGINKVLTVEASGIAIAAAVALEMNVPMVFAKKHKTSNVDGQVYSTPVHSFTHGNDYNMVVSRDYLTVSDRVLLVDDFLANGAALRGLVALVEQAGATLCGAAIAIEKRFQGGGDDLRSRGIRVESLAMIERFEDDSVVFQS